MREFIEYAGYRIMVFLVSITPFWLMYVLSDLFCFMVQYVIRYRRGVVESNLRRAFPEKEEKEIQRIRKRFYKNFMDTTFETIKSFSSSVSSIRKRIRLENPEILDELYKHKKSCILLMAHYGTWEWVPFTGKDVNHTCCSIYKPQRNRKINDHLLKKRQQTGLQLFSQKQTGLMIRTHINTPGLFTFITDQNPPGDIEDEYWIDFLNNKTPVYKGAESFAKKFDLPVFYYDLQRVKRGRFIANVIPICLKPADSKKGEIVKTFMNTLERVIIEKPENWLWSHKRWKKPVPQHLV
jgi:Kdo2-lipid IVA lauroyltransferase/acyltransferase